MGNAVNGILPGGGRLQAADQTDEGGLARAVLAHQAVNRATGHVDGEPAQCLEAPVLLSKACGGEYIVQKNRLLRLMAIAYQATLQKAVKKMVKN